MMPTPSMDDTRNELLGGLLAKYKARTGLHALRAPYAQRLIRETFDISSQAATAKSAPARRRETLEFLTAFHKARSLTLGQDAWQVELLKWLGQQTDFVELAARPRRRASARPVRNTR